MEEEKKTQSKSAKEKTSKTKKTKKAVDNSNEVNSKVVEVIQEKNTTTQKPVEEKKKQTKKSSTTKTKTTSTTSNKPKTKGKTKQEDVKENEIIEKQSVEEAVIKEEPNEEIKTTVEEKIETGEKEKIKAETTEINEEDKKETEEAKTTDSTEKREEKPVSEKYILVKEKYQKEKKHIKTLISVSILVIAIMLFSVIFALFNINSTKILDGVSILKIDVSGLSIDEARQRVNDAIQTKFTNENDNVILKHGETEVSVNANTFNSKFDVETAVAEAYNIGRKGNIITDNYSVLYAKIFKKDITPNLQLDEELLKSSITDLNSKMSDRVIEHSYYIEDEKLIIVMGKEGYTIKTEELSNQIIEQFKNVHTPYQEIEVPVENKIPDEIDLEKIRNEIYKEPKDAYVEKNPTKVHVEEDGVDFGISIEEIKTMMQEKKEEYEIPLKITKAKKKLSDLGEEAFPDQISTFSTIYDASAYNRSTNIALAAKKINGTIVMPGEIFSYNKVVGRRTIEAGFKEGISYIGGKSVPDVGGGVCQVSSTLYNTALLANLDITERSNHMFLTGYVSASRDATVYYGSLDFCFKNTRNYPIKITASAKNGVCKVSMYGIKEETEYEVIIQSKVISYINYKTTYKEDPTLEEGKEVVEQYGHTGCISEGYKILKKNGKVVSQTLLSKDSYRAKERIVRKGTKKVAKPSETTPTTPTKPTANITE